MMMMMIKIRMTKYKYDGSRMMASMKVGIHKILNFTTDNVMMVTDRLTIIITIRMVIIILMRRMIMTAMVSRREGMHKTSEIFWTMLIWTS